MGLISNGTTIFDNGSMASGFGGSLSFISKQTASSSASISFTSGIDSTYKEYIFYFVSLHVANDNNNILFNFSTDGGSNYNVTKTTTLFRAYHHESDGTTGLAYYTGGDLAQSSDFQRLTKNMENSNDNGFSGYMHVFNPSSTTFVKHFMSRSSSTTYHPYNFADFVAGYGNTTSAINAVQFKAGSGNIDSGDILLYGVN
jgi:hypothetical protein